MPAKSFNPAGILIFLVVSSIFGMLVWQFAANRTAESGSAPFDRAAAAELEIKGDVPDGASSWNAIEVPKSPPATAELVARGRDLFAKACAGCHGAQGKGDGPVAKHYELPSTPANLSAPLQSVKLHTTLDEAGGGIPADSDLFRTITRGLPGTQMFSYRALPDADRWALVYFVKTLSPDYEKDAMEPQPIPEKPAGGDLPKIGAQYYRSICVNCHGEAGLGGMVPLMMNGREMSGVRFARNGGMYMLGGSSEADIARTLMVGLNSLSPMRGVKRALYPDNLSKEQKLDSDRKFWGTVLYVRELIEAQKKSPQDH